MSDRCCAAAWPPSSLQEVRYNADFQLLQMERRVARAEGRRSRDETEALAVRIAQLERALGAAAAEHGMLVEEVKRAEDDHGATTGGRHGAACEREAQAPSSSGID